MIFLLSDPVALSCVRAKKRESSVFIPSRHLNCREDGEEKKQKSEKETDRVGVIRLQLTCWCIDNGSKENTVTLRGGRRNQPTETPRALPESRTRASSFLGTVFFKGVCKSMPAVSSTVFECMFGRTQSIEETHSTNRLAKHDVRRAS